MLSKLGTVKGITATLAGIAATAVAANLILYSDQPATEFAPTFASSSETTPSLFGGLSNVSQQPWGSVEPEAEPEPCEAEDVSCETTTSQTYMPHPLQGFWEIESPGAPYLDRTWLMIRGQASDPIEALDVQLIWRFESDTGYRRDAGQIKLIETGNGGFKFGAGQFAYCQCDQVWWTIPSAAGGNVLTGNWRYPADENVGQSDWQTGQTLWRRRADLTADIKHVIIRHGDAEASGAITEFPYGTQVAQVKRRGPVSCDDRGGPRPCGRFEVDLYGTDFSGFRRLRSEFYPAWIAPETRLAVEYGPWDGGWICADGSVIGFYGNNFANCGFDAGKSPIESVVGVRLIVDYFTGVQSGRVNLRVDGQPIAIKMEIEGTPEPDDEAELLSLKAYGDTNSVLSELLEGVPFYLEATYAEPSSKEWIAIEVPRLSEIDALISDPETIILQRTDNDTVFRSDWIAIEETGYVR